MKRTLITTACFFALYMPVCASTVIMDYQGETVVNQTTVERNLLINSEYNGNYNIAIKPLETVLSNVDGSIQIPLDKLYINNTREDVYLRYNEYSNIYNAVSMNGAPRNLTAKIRDFGMVPAGTYTLNFEVQAIDIDSDTVEATSVFNLQFIVPVVQEINLHNEIPKIVIGAKEAFDKNKKVVSETSPMVYINSNCDWELAINADHFGDAVGNYYVRTVSASSGVNERLLEKVLLQPGNEFVIAKGKAPANNEYVAVEFSLESKDGKCIKSGNYDNKVKYILRERR